MLIGTAVFLLLVVLLLAVPVTLTYRLSWKESPSADLRLVWAFGLVHADVSPDLAKPGIAKPAAAREKGAWWRKSSEAKPRFLAAIRQPAFRRRILRFVSDVWRAIHKKNVELLVRMGLGDPADTGQLWAVLGPLSGMSARTGDIRVAVEPDFNESTLEVDSGGTLWIIPLQIVSIAFGLLFSPPVWRGIMSMRTSG